MKRYTFRHTKNRKPRKVTLLLRFSTLVRVQFPLLRKLHRNMRLFLFLKALYKSEFVVFINYTIIPSPN